MGAPAVSVYAARLPFEFIHWWYLEAPKTLFKRLEWIFAAFIHLFSIKEAVTTYFRPWKNEYREGLVRTSIFIGAFIKTLVVIFDIFILSVILAVEVAIFIGWLVLPAVATVLLYGAIFA